VAWTYYITDRKTCPVPLIENIRRAIHASVDFIQIREKDLPTRDLFELSVQAAALAREHSTRILVNDRLDIALAAGLDGIHLGQSSVPPRVIRQRVSTPKFLIGVSTHSLEEIRAVKNQEVSLVTFGPVFQTPSKVPYGAPVGLEALGQAVLASPIPVLALGGVDAVNCQQCLSTGVAGIAAIRLFQDPGGFPTALVQSIRQSPMA
jgi:thiamine-phosphate pyrophosphorylase